MNRVSVTKDVKKEVDATLDFLTTVIKGHWLACASEILGLSSLDGSITADFHTAPDIFLEELACKVVDRFTVVDAAFLDLTCECSIDDKAYNYARVLCHYGALVMEFRDAWAEGDGERIMRCWKLFMPHFRASGCTKYCLEALRLQLQVNVVLSPNLAHQIMWHRTVNTKGGLGKNIPCDLYNEHVNKLIKYIIQNMGSNLTETSLQRAVRSISTLHSICKAFDVNSCVPYGTSAHSTKPDIQDVKKVVAILLQCKLLEPIAGRKHNVFPDMRLNPLYNWDVKQTKAWIENKKREYIKFQGTIRTHRDADEDGYSEALDLD